MTTFITIYHDGVVITNEIDSYEFIGMKKETFLLNEFTILANVVCLVPKRLGWIYEGCEVWFKGCIDIGLINGPWMKTMSPVCDENEWTTYVSVVMKSEICVIELVARMVARNDVGDESSRSPTFLKRLMSGTSNAASCLRNCRKKLKPTLMQRSLRLLLVMKQWNLKQ
jgi:hypothetical protein